MARLGFDDRFAGRLAEWRQELTVWERDLIARRGTGREHDFQDVDLLYNKFGISVQGQLPGYWGGGGPRGR
jgi:hypothetical protein